MYQLEIEYEEHKGGSAITQVDSHGVHVCWGSFTNVRLTNMNIQISGADKLRALFEGPVEKVKELIVCAPCYSMEQSMAETKRRNSIPKSAVRPIKTLALQIILEHFAENPKDFIKWWKKHSADRFAKGRGFQAHLIRKALSGG